MSLHRFTLLFLILTLLMVNCADQVAAGGIGHEGEAKVIGRVGYEHSDSIPEGASVFILPHDYISMSGSKTRVADAVVDDSGCFEIKSVASGKYIIEINDGFKNAVSIHCRITPDTPLIALPVDTLQPTGTVHGKLFGFTDTTSSLRVHLSGLGRTAEINSKTDSFSIQDVPAGNFRLVVSHSATDTFLVSDSITITRGATTFIAYEVSDQGVKKSLSKKLFLNTSSSGAGISDNVYDFPVLIRLNRNNFDFSSAQQNGSDLYFTANDSDLLPHEIEYWNPDEPQASIWVLLDTVYGDQDTQYVNVHWGRNSDTHNGISNNVFDTASGFQGVWHFSEPPGDTLKDATVNNFFGIFQGNENQTRVKGRIGTAAKFDGVSNYVEMPTTADSKLNFPEKGTYSLSAWVYADELDNRYQEIISKSNQLYGLQLNDSNRVEFYEYSIEDAWCISDAPISSGQWHLLTGVRDGEQQYLYIDGVCVDSTVTSNGGIRRRVLTEPLCVGNRVSTSESGFFKGAIDEVRIHNRALSAGWIKLCYVNQCSDENVVEFR